MTDRPRLLKERNFAEVVQFSLCSLDPDPSGEGRTFRQYTLFEMPLLEPVAAGE
jgi:hypothetical protein